LLGGSEEDGVSDGGNPRPEAHGRHDLVGRARERSVIDALLGDAIHDRSGALVISGARGLGKSSLLRYAVDDAATSGSCRSRGRAFLIPHPR